MFTKVIFFLAGVIGFIVFLSRYIWNRRLHRLTYFDQLTAAFNRTSFTEEFNKLDFEGGRGVGMYIDLDSFKQINKKYGHHIGDLILKETVNRLQKLFEKKSVFRMAGDEFVVLQRESHLAMSLELAQKTIEELKKPMKILGKRVEMGVNIGICKIDSRLKNSEDFLYWAIVAINSAKKNPYDSIVIATEKLVREFDNKKELEGELKKALIKGEISTSFQPKVDLSSGKIIGLEALARWKHWKKGVVSPGVFIPLAEEMGLISNLDFIVAETTIVTLKKWLDCEVIPEDFKASFNISVNTFERMDVYGNLKFLMEKYGVPGEVLEVEVTESVFINKISKVMRELSSLKEKLGVTVALDDFSAGHSSLRELGKLSIDTLKLDRSLLQVIKENPERGRLIYSNLINLCNDMGYISVAEGIEDDLESEFLKKEGVKYGQGYHFGKPMSEDDFLKVLKEANK